MNKINILLFRGIVFSFVICLLGVAYAYADGYEALNELNDIKVVFDVRSKTVKSAAIHSIFFIRRIEINIYLKCLKNQNL